MSHRKGTYKMVEVVSEEIVERNGFKVRVDVLSCGHKKRHFDYTEYYANEMSAQIGGLMRQFSGKLRKTRCFECAGGSNCL